MSSSEVSPCGSCRNLRFRGTYRLHLQGEINQQTDNMLAGALCRINHYMRKEVIEWDILHGGQERTRLQRCLFRVSPLLNVRSEVTWFRMWFPCYAEALGFEQPQQK
jgi:hypothetical protein